MEKIANPRLNLKTGLPWMPPKHFIRESDAKPAALFHAAGFAGIYVTVIWQPVLKSSSRGSPLTYLFFGVFCFRII